MILASGMLDGPVEGPHGVHVVRGSSEKYEYHNKEASESTENAETGAVTTKDVYSERMITTIRCVDHNGVIYTHSNAPEENEKSESLLDDSGLHLSIQHEGRVLRGLVPSLFKEHRMSYRLRLYPYSGGHDDLIGEGELSECRRRASRGFATTATAGIPRRRPGAWPQMGA